MPQEGCKSLLSPSQNISSWDALRVQLPCWEIPKIYGESTWRRTETLQLGVELSKQPRSMSSHVNEPSWLLQPNHAFRCLQPQPKITCLESSGLLNVDNPVHGTIKGNNMVTALSHEVLGQFITQQEMLPCQRSMIDRLEFLLRNLSQIALMNVLSLAGLRCMRSDDLGLT